MCPSGLLTCSITVCFCLSINISRYSHMNIYIYIYNFISNILREWTCSFISQKTIPFKPCKHHLPLNVPVPSTGKGSLALEAPRSLFSLSVFSTDSAWRFGACFGDDGGTEAEQQPQREQLDGPICQDG